MNVIEPTTPESQLKWRKLPKSRLPVSAPTRDTAVMRVRDLAAMVRILSEQGLLDALETELLAQGCSSFRIDAKPMRITSAFLRRKLQDGTLPIDTPGLFAICGSLSDPGAAAGEAGGAENAIPPAEKAKEGEEAGQVIPAGQSQGSKDKPQ